LIDGEPLASVPPAVAARVVRYIRTSILRACREGTTSVVGAHRQPRGSRSLRRPSTAVIVACVASLSVGGCTSGAKGSSRSSFSATTDRGPAVVIRAYEAYWDDVLNASNPPMPKSSVLGHHATGTALAQARQVLVAEAKLGQAVRGSYKHDTQILAMTGPKATLADCLTVRASVYKIKSNKIAIRAPRAPVPIKVEMTVVGKAWKVSRISSATRTCGEHPVVPPARTSSSKTR
jgi:hypothetical protein